MAKASNNEFPSVLLAEQSSAPTAPSGATARLYIDNTARPLLKSIDSASDVVTYLSDDDIVDEDDMVSDSATLVPSQQSVKAYVDNNAGGGVAAVTLNAQTGTTYTLVLSDAAKLVTLDNAAAITLTVPPNSSVAFATGTRIALLQKGAGQVTVAQGAGVTVNTSETLKLQDQWSAAELIKLGTDSWVLVGRLEAAP